MGTLEMSEDEKKEIREKHLKATKEHNQKKEDNKLGLKKPTKETTK